MSTLTTQTSHSERLRPGHGACRSELQRELERLTRAPDDSVVALARLRVFERVLADLGRYGLDVAIRRAEAAYRRVPLVPKRLCARHPAARARGEAFEQVFEAAGVDAVQIELLRRIRPRFVDEPQAAS